MLKNLQLHCDVWFEIEFKLQSYQNLIKFLDLNLNENLIEKTKIKRKTSFHSDFKPSFSLNLKFSLAHQAPAIFVKFFFITYLLTAFMHLLHLFICLFVFFDIPVAFTLWELLKFQKLFSPLIICGFNKKLITRNLTIIPGTILLKSLLRVYLPYKDNVITLCIIMEL